MPATGRQSFTTDMAQEARRALERRRASLLTRPSTPERESELLELEAALARIEAGTWGRCERCGGAVGRDRLRALPETRVCLPCAKLPPSPTTPRR
jgi:RNA polymerase-binding transcription factor DksA